MIQAERRRPPGTAALKEHAAALQSCRRKELEHCVLYKSPDSQLPDSQSRNITHCASEPSGVHPLSHPCNLVNTFQMRLMEIMCGSVPWRLQAASTRLSEEDPLCQRSTAVTTATAANPALTVGGGGWGCRKVCSTVRREEKQTANFASQLQDSLFSLSSRGSYCTAAAGSGLQPTT